MVTKYWLQYHYTDQQVITVHLVQRLHVIGMMEVMQIQRISVECFRNPTVVVNETIETVA